MSKATLRFGALGLIVMTLASAGAWAVPLLNPYLAVRPFWEHQNGRGVRGDLCVTNMGDVPARNVKASSQIEQYDSDEGIWAAIPGATTALAQVASIAPGEVYCASFVTVSDQLEAGGHYRDRAAIGFDSPSGAEIGYDFDMPEEPVQR